MKCDTCVHARFEGASSNPDVGRPWPEAWCAEGKWGGIPDPNETEPKEDPWKDCEKYKEHEKQLGKAQSASEEGG